MQIVGFSGVAGLAALLLVATPLSAQQRATASTVQPPARGVPNVVGLRLDSARKILSLNKLLPRIEPKSDGSGASATDTVIQQRPQAAQPIPFSRLVSLTLKVTPPVVSGTSDGPSAQQQLVPNIIGLSLDSAQRILTLGRLRMRATTTPSGVSTLPSDVVTRQSPLARQPVPRDRVVNADVAVDVIRVPDVIGSSLRSARSQLGRFDVRVQLASNSATPNTVFRQEPAPSTLARPGTVVSVYDAQAVQMPQQLVPNVVGRLVEDANAILSQAGLQGSRAADDDDANVAAGVVVSQNPRDGLRVDPGTRVDLTVRSNRVRVPVLLSLSEADARQQLAAAGLQTASVDTREDSATSGTVIEQSLPARTLVERGSAISIVIAKPVARALIPQTPEPRVPQRRDPAPTPAAPSVVVPDIVGLPRAQAQAVASRAGFALIVAPGQTARDVDTVVKQFPAARSSVTDGFPVLMAEFNAIASPTRPPWLIWVALVPLVAAAGAIARKRVTTPQQVALPPITYAAGARPPTFTIEDRGLSRGLGLSLSVKNDPGVQGVSRRGVNAG
jgi:beta-lactam-binding protein with PASTA domain